MAIGVTSCKMYVGKPLDNHDSTSKDGMVLNALSRDFRGGVHPSFCAARYGKLLQPELLVS